MLDHITITTKDFEKTISFYEKLLRTLGIQELVEYKNEVVGFGKDKPFFWIGANDNRHPVSQNIHLGFVAENKDQVEEFYKVAIEQGATNNGKPGYRVESHEGYYACFVLDFDGNNIEAVFREATS